MGLRQRTIRGIAAIALVGGLAGGGASLLAGVQSAAAATTPTISTQQQPATATVGSSIADKATVSSALFTCPPQDNAGFALGQSDTSTDPIFCSYPAFSGENANDFFCIYSASTGALVTDNDVGFCPANAVNSGGSAPTGTVTFNLYDNSSATGTPLFTDTENLVSGAATSAGYTATVAGTDYWVATYNGNLTFNSVTSGASAEPVTITGDSDLAIATRADITTDATGPSGAKVTYSLPTVTDPDDTSAPTPSCVPASGSTFPITTSTPTTVTCTATDTDDTNSPVTSSFTVTVVGAAGQITALQHRVIGVGPGTSLYDKLAQARSYLAANDKADACGVLNAFINEVNAQSGKSISTSTAASLVASAKQIEAVIGC